MSINYRRHVISEFVRLHVMKAHWEVEVYAAFILNALVSLTLQNVISAPTEHETGWIPGPF
jgi:hypothetical protein